jgi:hypothetical protein
MLFGSKQSQKKSCARRIPLLCLHLHGRCSGRTAGCRWRLLCYTLATGLGYRYSAARCRCRTAAERLVPHRSAAVSRALVSTLLSNAIFPLGAPRRSCCLQQFAGRVRLEASLSKAVIKSADRVCDGCREGGRRRPWRRERHGLTDSFPMSMLPASKQQLYTATAQCHTMARRNSEARCRFLDYLSLSSVPPCICRCWTST